MCPYFPLQEKEKQECKLLGMRRKGDGELQVAEGIYMTENEEEHVIFSLIFSRWHVQTVHKLAKHHSFWLEMEKLRQALRQR